MHSCNRRRMTIVVAGRGHTRLRTSPKPMSSASCEVQNGSTSRARAVSQVVRHRPRDTARVPPAVAGYVGERYECFATRRRVFR